MLVLQHKVKITLNIIGTQWREVRKYESGSSIFVGSRLSIPMVACAARLLGAAEG